MSVDAIAALDEQEQANYVPIKIVTGVSRELSFRVTLNDAILDLTGFTIKAQVRAKLDDLEPLITFSVINRVDAAGTFGIQATPADTNAVGSKVKSGWWSCVIVWPDGVKSKELAHGDVTFRKGATS